MSHIEEGKTNLVFQALPAVLRQGHPHAIAQHPCIKLLHQAVLLVAKQYGGEVRSSYSDYWGKEHATNTGIALHIPEQVGQPKSEALPRGLGMVIDEETGALTFLGDPWDVDETFYQSVQHAIVQKYTALAHMAALQQMHYQVSSQQVEGRIHVTGGTYVE